MYIFIGDKFLTGFTRIISISALSFLSLFCFYVCEFIKQSRLNFSIILHPKEAIKRGIPVQLFIVIFLCLLGIVLTIISQFTNLFYYFDENNIYHRSALYPLSVLLGLLPGLITLTMFLQNRKKFAKNVFVTLLIYFIRAKGLLQS